MGKVNKIFFGGDQHTFFVGVTIFFKGKIIFIFFGRGSILFVLESNFFLGSVG